MVAASTPVTGATVPIRPTASPRYRQLIPTTPAMPDTTDQPTSAAPGHGSVLTTVSTAAMAIPTNWLTSTIPSPGARRLSRPPP